MASSYELKTINPRPPIDEALIAPFRALYDVLSISCVVSDSMDRANTMDCGIVPRGANKKIIGPLAKLAHARPHKNIRPEDETGIED